MELVKRDKPLQILPGPDKNVQSLVMGVLTTVELAYWTVCDCWVLELALIELPNLLPQLQLQVQLTPANPIAEPTASTSTAETTLVKLSALQTLEHTPALAAASVSSEQTQPVHDRVDQEKVVKIVLKKLSLGPKDQILITQDIMDSIPQSRYTPSSPYIPVAEYCTMPDTNTVSFGEETVAYSSNETELYWPLDMLNPARCIDSTYVYMESVGTSPSTISNV